MKKSFTITTLCLAAPFFIVGCTSSGKSPNLPSQAEYQGYKIIDGIDKNSVSLSIGQEDKIAVVIRDISTTAYSYLEPRYNNAFVNFEGKSICCTPTNGLIGASGSAVYKFSFIGKGKTAIRIIARQKGLSITSNSFDTDKEFSINVEVD